MSDLDIYKYSYIDGDKVVETEEGKFFITPKCNDKAQIFRYLEQKNFPFFLPMANSFRDSYEIYPYVDDGALPADKALDLIHILSLLHIKTTTYQTVVMDKVKELYESISSQIQADMVYYQALQDEIETHIYMAPDEALFMKNVSLFYQNLQNSREYLELWYETKKGQKEERVVFLHKQPCLSFFVDQKTPYFTHWDFSDKGYVIYDFLFFYKKDYTVVEMNPLFQIYQSKYKFNEDEMFLFYCLLLLDERMEFVSSNHYESTIVVQKHVSYAKAVSQFILKQNQKDKETD